MATAFLAGGGRRFAVGAAPPTNLKFAECWVTGMKFSEKVKALDGKRVVMRGFMAPPLKPDADFFVLTRIPMAVCPFCETETDWPDDIVLVKLSRPHEFVQYNVPIKTTGTLQIGTDIDEETGFVSRLRIVGATFEEMLG
jgi:hypothetical protein